MRPSEPFSMNWISSLYSVKVKVSLLCCVRLCATQWTPARLLCLWNSQDRNTGVGHHSLLQGSLQGSNPGLLYYRQILYRLSHQGSPCVLYMYIIYIYAHYVK